MKREGSLKLNFIMNAILTMSSLVFPIITFPYVSRILLPIGTGKVAFATSVISYFNMFAQLGIPTYGIRVCAQVRDDREKLTKVAQELLIINLILSVVSYAALFAAIAFVPKLREEKTLFFIISATILLTAIGMEWLYKALEQYTYITVRSVIFKIIALVGMFLLIHQQSDYVIYGGITIFAASASNILNFINARKYIDMRPVGGYHFRPHLKALLVFFAMSCATTIYLHMDAVMLGFMKDDTEVGYYNAAVKIKTILVSIVTSLGTVLLPRVSYYIQQGNIAEFRRITKKAINFVFLAACPMTLFFIFFARQGVLLLSGSEYMPSIPCMQIIMPTLLFIGLSNIMGIQMLVPMGKEKIVLYSEIAGAITDLLLNAILIPKLGASGAAIGTVVAEAVVFLVQYVYLRTEVTHAFRAVQYWKMIIAMIAGSAASLWVIRLDIGNFLMLLIAAVLFFGVYLIILLLKELLVKEIVSQILSKIKKKVIHAG